MENSKMEQYMRYITDHIKYIQTSWEVFKLRTSPNYVPTLSSSDERMIGELIRRHDESKFSADEFKGYRQWFYPVDGEAIKQDMFDRAWLHHIHNNPHHWEHWVLNGKPLEIPFKYVIEMIVDWMAMSFQYQSCPVKWWQENQSKMILHPETIKLIDDNIYKMKDPWRG